MGHQKSAQNQAPIDWVLLRISIFKNRRDLWVERVHQDYPAFLKFGESKIEFLLYKCKIFDFSLVTFKSKALQGSEYVI